MRAQLCFAPQMLHIRAWAPEGPGMAGFDPRSAYAEEFWLGILGPSTMWLLRRIAAGFDYCADGFDLDMAETAASLGIGDHSGRHTPMIRAVNRTVQFGLAKLTAADQLSVRRALPPLSRQQLGRLPRCLQERHALWMEGESTRATTEQQQRRACPQARGA